MSIHFASNSRPHFATAQKAVRPQESLRRALRSAARNWKRRKMIAALGALDDRTLREIGLDRENIARMVEAFDDRELAMTPLDESGTFADPDQETCRKAA
ncbi:hypothetical protein ACEWPL_016520 [Roseovarius sp. S1116L3]|uniref:hypothetical protein n=1 Tax=Roseovarius roseus TaxID=3342636 RepID=UPI00372B80E6